MKTKNINFQISPYLVLLLAVSIFIDVAVLISEKIAAQYCGHNTNLIVAGMNFYSQLLYQPWTWFSLALTGVQLVIWRDLLKYIELTFACCITSVVYPLTALAGVLFLKSDMQPIEWLGIGLVTIGIILTSTDKSASVNNIQI